MFVIVHKEEKLLRVEEYKNNVLTLLPKYQNFNLDTILFELSDKFQDSKIAWCLEELYGDIDWKAVDLCVQRPMQIFSYNPSHTPVFNEVLSYANFLTTTADNIPQNVRFPTWVTSAAIGVTHAKLINKFCALSGKYSFQISLNAISHMGTTRGALHYSEPNLCTKKIDDIKQESLLETLNFIKNFLGMRWVVYTSLLYYIQHKKNFLTLVRRIFSKKYSFDIQNLKDLYDEVDSESIDENDTIDVLIPTLGRKEFLKDVLDDLSQQTLLPKNVIIVEQHPDTRVSSELDYIYTNKWPFTIKHKYIHQLGACNARNVGLEELESKWMFAADDDIRFNENLLEDAIAFMKTHSIGAVSMATYLPSQRKKKFSEVPYMFDGFASGASIINQKYCRNLPFDMAFEFGYGEDTAYGCELRKRGCEVVYYPYNPILHLKAPVGGFRFTFEHAWSKDEVQPKPSPSIMYFYKKYMNKEQIFAYKVFLFFSLVKKYKKINILSFGKRFNAQWKRSEYWADDIKRSL